MGPRALEPGLTLEQITKAVLQPVRIRWVGKREEFFRRDR